MNQVKIENILQKYPQFVLKKDLSPEMLKLAVKNVAPSIREEDVIAYYDSSNGKGRRGFIITEDALHIYVKNEKISFNEVTEVKLLKNLDYIEVVFENQVHEKILVMKPNGQLIVEVMNDILGMKRLHEKQIERTPQLLQKTDNPFDSALEAYDKQEYDRAYLYFEMEAENNNDLALFNLGVMCELGQGILRDSDKAFRYFLKAAELGNPDGAYNVGIYYEENYNDMTNAQAWFERAKKLGYRF